MWAKCIFTGLTLLYALRLASGEQKYEIATTWNNSTIDHEPVIITLDHFDTTCFKISVKAPLFNDPIPPGAPGQPFYGLWDYEVAEVFFLNDQDQYVEIELGPHGQHIVLLLNGERKTVRHSLLIEYTNERTTNNTWNGTAYIPIEYLPPNVTKMNAYAIHGTGDNRTYESLYPVPFGAIGPDFHNLTAFGQFDSSIILSSTPVTTLSQTWSDSLNGIRSLQISKTWTNEPLPIDETVQLKLSNKNNASLQVVVNAPFYNDPAPAASPSNGPLKNLSNYEMIHLYFLGTNGEYLEVELGPWGHYLVDFWSNYNNRAGNSSFTINYNVTTSSTSWTATAVVPMSYLPPNVTKCNAFLAHGPNELNRTVSALYPAGPLDPYDFRNASFYRAIDFDIVYPWTKNESCSPVWCDVYPSCSGCKGADSGAVSYIIARPLFVVSLMSFLLTYVVNF